jgi:hypothetical protein
MGGADPDVAVEGIAERDVAIAGGTARDATSDADVPASAAGSVGCTGGKKRLADAGVGAGAALAGADNAGEGRSEAPPGTTVERATSVGWPTTRWARTWRLASQSVSMPMGRAGGV